MRWIELFSVGALLLVAFAACAPNADNRQDQKPTAEAATSQAEPVADHGAEMSSPSSEASPIPSSESPGSLPFIAEAKAPFVVIDLLSPGRLEVVAGCLTVNIQGKPRGTAVFPPGVKPEIQGNALVAVSFNGRRIPLDQEASIPGGFVQLSSADLVKPIPAHCPKALFGL
jgi:hypothetical protein